MCSTKDEKVVSQYDRFKETARQLGCDEDKERFEAQLGKIAAKKPEKATGTQNDQRPRPQKPKR